MGKSAKVSEPLQVLNSRIEKSRRSKRNKRTRPSWYHRVLNISFTEDREVCGYDFDEDLSELEENKVPPGDKVEQLKNRGHSDSEDDGSETSYGSEACYYWDLKEEREERKREKLQGRKKKEQQRDFEKAQEEVVRVAYISLKKDRKKGKTAPVGLLAGQDFKLFSSDHVNHFYHFYYPTKKVEFYHLDDKGNSSSHDGNETDMLYGEVWLNGNTFCNFGPFCPPKHARSKTVKVRSDDDKYDLSFKFIGHGKLKLSASREMVFMNPYSASPANPPAAAPEVFEFVGIGRDLEKEEEERQKRMAKGRRSPSPRESWFEMNHPMGWWHRSRNF